MLSISRGFGSLRHRNYRLYSGSQLISQIGWWMQGVSVPWLLLELGGTPMQLGLVVALQFGPAMFLAPFGGVLADRMDKRKLLLVTESLAMTQALIMFTLAITGAIEIWHILALVSGMGLLSAIDMPVRAAFAAELIPKDELLNGIALNSASFNLARILGPALAGVVIATVGNGANFGINGATYLAALGGLIAMDARAIRKSVSYVDRRAPIRSSLAAGVRYAWQTPTVLWSLVLLSGIFLFAMNFSTLLPLFAHDALGLDGAGYGALFAAMGVGALGAALLLAFIGSRPVLLLILGAGGAFALFEVLLGLSRSAAIAYPLMAGNGFFGMLLINGLNGVIQYHVPDELRGRVMALWVTVFAASVPIGALFAGTIAEHWGSAAGFVIGGLAFGVVLTFVAWQFARDPSVALRRPEVKPRLALEREPAP